ncbi:MAG: CoA transferase [Hyphomicrobiales bacterium]|nr:CoA transferase [Hyphomicrobiales bacterium]
MREERMKKAFGGLRVLDFSTTIAGPYCARLLADLGADVVKIESHEGDVLRSRPPMRNGASTAYGQLNAGKRSIVLDLKKPAAVEAIHRLAEKADVLVENFRPGVMKRLKLDYPALHATNPRLVYCSMSGYGQTGPGAEKPAYAPVVHAASGYDLAHLAYQGGRDRPDFCGIFHADVVSGVYAYSAIATALYQREQTGQGQHIDVSMMESMLSLTLNELQGAQFDVVKPSRPMFGPVETKDGYVMVAVVTERAVTNFVAAAGRLELLSDPRFVDYPARRKHWGELMEELEKWSRTLTRDECIAALEKHDVPCSAYRTVAEALADPQLDHRDALADVTDAGGVFKALNPPFRMSDAVTRVGKHSPALGEHTRAVLQEAGFDHDAIARATGRA